MGCRCQRKRMHRFCQANSLQSGLCIIRAGSVCLARVLGLLPRHQTPQPGGASVPSCFEHRNSKGHGTMVLSPLARPWMSRLFLGCTLGALACNHRCRSKHHSLWRPRYHTISTCLQSRRAAEEYEAANATVIQFLSKVIHENVQASPGGLDRVIPGLPSRAKAKTMPAAGHKHSHKHCGVGMHTSTMPPDHHCHHTEQEPVTCTRSDHHGRDVNQTHRQVHMCRAAAAQAPTPPSRWP